MRAWNGGGSRTDLKGERVVRGGAAPVAAVQAVLADEVERASHVLPPARVPGQDQQDALAHLAPEGLEERLLEVVVAPLAVDCIPVEGVEGLPVVPLNLRATQPFDDDAHISDLTTLLPDSLAPALLERREVTVEVRVVRVAPVVLYPEARQESLFT